MIKEKRGPTRDESVKIAGAGELTSAEIQLGTLFTNKLRLYRPVDLPQEKNKKEKNKRTAINRRKYKDRPDKLSRSEHLALSVCKLASFFNIFALFSRRPV
jgi:hypothetical protein